MSIKLRFVTIFAVLLSALFLYNACNRTAGKIAAVAIGDKPFKKLSEYNFFTGTLNQLLPNERVLPYDLITPLFTDYAFKARFVYVPEGKSAELDTTQVLQLPVGSCLIKNFYYPEDFQKPEGKRRIIETRLLVHRENGWENLDYIWNDEQTEAMLDNAGDIKKVSWVHYDGTKREIDYVIPNKNQCKGCHWRNEKSFSPIGPKVRNLNRDYAYTDGTENQLVRWAKMGFLKGDVQPENLPRIADWTAKDKHSVHERALAYLEMNCAHCHNPNGPAYTSGLYLNLENTNPENMGICKAPVATGKASGGRMYDIVPGHPDLSILTYRMESDDPGIKMPELGRVQVHTEGVALIRQWIQEMPARMCDNRD